jgi:bacillithiol biosynthesis cysteine-adding enzyme BshC
MFRFEPCGAAPYPAAYRAYVDDFARLGPFFAHPPDGAGLQRRASELDARWRGERGRVAAALAEYQERVGGDAAAARRLADPRALAVVAGQQAGVLTGPLYTVYKAVTVLRLAAACEAALGRPVVPVFWVASEDHDFGEVASTWAADAAGDLVRLSLPPTPGAGRRSVGDVPVPAAAAHLIERLVRLVPAPDPAACARLAGAWCPGQSLADWFARQMAALFAPRGLVLLDPMLPALRRLAAPLGALAWERAADVEAGLRAAGERLRAAGFEPALAAEPGHTHLFARVGGERQLILRRDGRAVTRRGEPVDPAALPPEDLSYGVALRPVVEAALLPVLAHVSGPGEVAYQAQLAGVFAALGVDPPVVVPRLGLTLVAPEDALFAAGPGTLRRLRAEPTAVVDEALAAEAGLDIGARFEEERAALRARYAALAGDLAGVSPALPRLADANLARLLAQVDYLERKARQHRRRSRREFVRAAAAARNRLFPRGRLQEQILNAWPFVLRFGLGWLDELCEAAPLNPGHHVARWSG